MDAAEQSVVDGVRGLCGDARYSDLTITCGSKVFNVHKAVVCTQSRYFEAAVKDCFQEGTESKITLDRGENVEDISRDDHEDAIQCMIDFLYGKPQYHCRGQSEDTSLSWLAVLYITADRYGIDKMRSAIVAKFGTMTAKLPAIYSSSTRFDRTHLVGIPALLKFIYIGLPYNDHSMKDALIQWLVHKSPCLLYSETMEDLLEEEPEFGVDLARSLRAKHCSPPSKHQGDVLLGG
ncbi:hypothetical protein BDZ85DRAFT_282857 [Elsinoe ampelina]|uniref:BTB domain-containing protein n=1 Tax=Elsinoe ampelina TaxID=302913 RepID=A0A6A6G7H1_9PEZI|nr:hypothetical protein BDZ85DRAFT_282857 [Elsinoe ampelina]